MKTPRLNVWILLLALIGLVWAINVAFTSPVGNTGELKPSTFMNEVEAGKVREIAVAGNRIQGLLDDGSRFTTYLPAPPSDTTLESWVARGIEVRAEPPRSTNTLAGILIPLLVVGLVFLAFWYFSRGSRGGDGSGAFNFTKSRARVLAEAPKTTFKDVAGAEEAKEELREIVEFLRNPDRYRRLGARIPKGVLLVGPPGTGKTLMARAVAGEAGVAFLSISGSEFVELFVGVGAARVRDLFNSARKHAPAIIFIDELDAVGRLRGAGLGGGHDEREQTLNQLLVEMDGFDSGVGIIVLAATNRPDVLDPALLRPGRFDRVVVVDRPDVKGRLQILKIHARKVPLADDVNLDVIARSTPGFAGADLANLINEAAILAARAGRERVTQKDLEEARDKIAMGKARKSMVISEEERRRIAYHEAGHALVSRMIPEADPISKVSIIPRGMAMGITQHMPEEDRHVYQRSYLLANLAVYMGGYTAEKLVFGEPSTGAANDIERATDLARSMVTQWGMSDRIGPVAFGKEEGEVFLGRQLTARRPFSEETARQIDQEVHRLIQEALARAEQILSEHRERLDRLAEALLEKETLTGEEVDQVLGLAASTDGASEPAEPGT
ncbi:MAG: ATP-dependent zinc metalloprotease FtsH [Candidatus Hydrothermae bacterium]|nr:ATP-dependent zinc metalloprotease FtsH [Candidatus Hydrothermae bacterium]